MRGVFVLNDIRAKFTRGEDIKYISHLDLMKLFERALRRSGVPVTYSQGFNPHPHIVFGLPLPVGVTSEAEYVDIEFSDALEPAELTERLNNEFPVGLKIIDAKKKNTKMNIMASIIIATYEILVSSDKKLGMEYIRGSIEKFMSREAAVVEKEGKNGLKDIDIKPMIHLLDVGIIEKNETEISETRIADCSKCLNPWVLNYLEKISDIDHSGLSYKIENIFCLSVKLSAGSKANLKPDLLVSAINIYTDMDLKLVKVHRTGLIIEKGVMVLDPLDEKALS